METIELLLLGSPDVRVDDESFLFERTKSLALLAYLVANGRPQARDWLATLLWPQSQTGRTQVRIALGELMRTPLAAHIRTTREQISVVADHLLCDLYTFERVCPPTRRVPPTEVDTLLRLYRGDFLKGLTVKHAPEFERWQRAQATRYRLRFEAAAEALIQQAMTRNQDADAMRYAAAVLEADPLNEVFCRYAMHLWTKLSQRHRAVAVYQRLHDGLAAWGIGPEQATKTLYQQLNSAVSSPLLPLAAPSDIPTGSQIPVPGPLIGRQQDLQQMSHRLRRGGRLLTVLGPSGVGKTHFAQALAYQCRDTFPGGAYLIEIDSAINGATLLGQVAKVIGVDVSPFELPNRLLRLQLNQAPVLLLIDNIHLVENAAATVHLLLSLSPDLCLIVTSYDALQLKDEYRLPLGGLTIVDAPSERLAPTHAVRLFLQVAQRADPTFELDEAAFNAVVQICRIVDGLPIGIILAATWTNTMSPGEILAEVEQGYEFLEAHYADLPSRHHSMTAVFERLWARLSDGERNALQVASVFRGGFTRDALQEIGNLSLYTLRALVDKHLLTRGNQHRTRYHLPNLLRQYAEQRLAQHDAADDLRQRHAAYFVEQVINLEPALKGHLQHQAWSQLAAESDNLTTAWRYLLAADNITLLDALIEPLRLYLQAAGLWSQGVALFDEARVALAQHHAQQTYWRLVARLYAVRPGTMARLHAAHDFAQAQDDTFEMGHTLCELGWQSVSRADYVAGKVHFEAAQVYWHNAPFYSALLAKGLAFCAIGQHAHDAAQRHTQEALRLRRLLGDHVGEHEMLIVAGELALVAGELDTAADLLDQAIAYLQQHFQPITASNRCIARGWVQLFKAEFAQAAAFARRLLQVDLPPGAIHASGYAMLGLAALLQGEARTAQACLDKIQFIFEPSWEWSSALNRDNYFFVLLCCAVLGHHCDDMRTVQAVFAQWDASAQLQQSRLAPWITILSNHINPNADHDAVPATMAAQPWLEHLARC